MIRKAFLTPDTSSFSSYGVWRFFVIPWELHQYIDGALGRLCEASQWEQFGDSSPVDVAENFTELLSDMLNFNPVGMLIPFVNDTVPNGLLLCDGSVYLAGDYPHLYDVIDNSLVVSSSQFRTPDLRGRFLLSGNSEYSIRSTGGEAEHTLSLSEIPQHSHQYTPPVPNIDLEAPGAPDIIAAGMGIPEATSIEGGGDAHNNMPPYYVVRYGMVHG